jgi:hypothetical protein
MKTTNQRTPKGKVSKQQEGIMPALFNFQMGRKLREEVKTLSDSKAKHTFELNKVLKEYEHYTKKNKGLKDIEKHFFNGEPQNPLNHHVHHLKTLSYKNLTSNCK